MEVKVMLKLPSLPITLSAAFIWSLFYFPDPGSTQDYPFCYMVAESGQVMNLEPICQRGQQMLAKANACNSPFDQDGFPVVFSQEVARLKRAIANARQTNVYVAKDAEVQSAIAALRNQMPFASQREQFQQQRQSLLRQLQATKSSVERARLREQLRANSSQFSQLTTNQCYRRFSQALANQLRPQTVPRLPTASSPAVRR